MVDNPLEFDISGIMIKHAPVKSGDDVLMQVQIKCSEIGEIRAMFRDFDRWGVENMNAMLPGTDIPWSKITLPLADYGMFFSVYFNADPARPDDGVIFDVKLDSISLSRKLTKDGIEVIECTYSMLKQVENSDARAIMSYLKYKEEDENGKKQLVKFPVNFKQCERFLLGTEKEEPSEVAEL